MVKIKATYLLFLSLLFAGLSTYAQQVTNLKGAVVRTDSSRIQPSKFNKAALNAYAEQKEFKYDEVKTAGLSLWDRFWMWFWKMIGNIFRGAASNPASKYFIIGLGIAVVVFIVVKLIGANNIFSKKSKETLLPYDILNENIHEIDYERELQKLMDEGKYRLAVRLLYLRALKKLSDAGIIEWQLEKTNYNYLSEIARPELKMEFTRLTYQFDYIWYGDFPIDGPRFEPISQSFNSFNRQIK